MLRRLLGEIACAADRHDVFTWLDSLTGEWWALCRRRGCTWQTWLGD